MAVLGRFRIASLQPPGRDCIIWINWMDKTHSSDATYYGVPDPSPITFKF